MKFCLFSSSLLLPLSFSIGMLPREHEKSFIYKIINWQIVCGPRTTIPVLDILGVFQVSLVMSLQYYIIPTVSSLSLLYKDLNAFKFIWFTVTNFMHLYLKLKLVVSLNKIEKKENWVLAKQLYLGCMSVYKTILETSKAISVHRSEVTYKLKTEITKPFPELFF